MRAMCFALLTALCPLSGLAALPAGAAAQIISVQGQGEQRAAEVAAWAPAQTQQALAGGAFVRTLAASKMALLFADETQVRLNQHSVLQVKQVDREKKESTLLLNLGRAWAQSKRPTGGRLNFETPAATAGIRGTDWELDVDASGKTLLTVFSGTVEFANAQGRLTVSSQQAVMAEVGRAPVRIVLSNPRQRIQWVSALSADPLRHLDERGVPATLRPALQALGRGDLSAPRAALAGMPTPATADLADWPVLLQAAAATLGGQTQDARQALQTLLAQPGSHPDAAHLMLSDLHLVAGDFDAASQVLQAGLQQHPQAADLLAQLARTQMLADQLEASASTLARTRDADTAAVLLAQGELARRQGLSADTLQAYTRATRVAPGDDRGWLGLGSAQAELERVAPARTHLQQALTLKPQAPGAQGELGTLETFANRFGPAEQAFASALAHNPADYVALTGLGLLRLKQGQPEAALDAFLRAGVMEPRYARAKAYTAVAYYQLGRHSDAIEAMTQASALDDKDPLPYLFLSQMHTDLLQPGEAVQAARAAVQRLPYLKSLNQVANDQKGSANFGAALAFFGLEDWALELAQRSYSPYWGGSHLFLADRYLGEFNKNSELFQGFLSDPLAFGASNRFSSLLQRAGHYGQLEFAHDDMGFVTRSPSITLNGLGNSMVPLAYFVQWQPARATDFGLDVGASGQPLMADPSGSADIDAGVGTLGLGVQATDQLGLFFYHNSFTAKVTGRNSTFGISSAETGYLASTRFDLSTRQTALGLAYRWTPDAQTWVKVDRSSNRNTVTAYPTQFSLDGLDLTLGMDFNPDKRFSDLQLRHTMDLSPATRLSLGLEQVRETQYSNSSGLGLLSLDDDSEAFLNGLAMAFAGTNDIRRRFTGLDFSLQHRLSAAWQLDASLGFNRLHEQVIGQNATALEGFGVIDESEAQSDQTWNTTHPRLGLVYQPNDQFSLRLAYQDWMRPLSVSTLAPVQTAGIALEDRLLEAGGRLKRSVLQLGWTPDAQTFWLARLDRQDINNPVAAGVDLRTPSLPFLEALRNAQSFNLSSIDLLEATPEVERGRLDAVTLAVNRLLTANLSGYAKYIWQDGRNRSHDNSTPRLSDGLRMAFVPKNTLALGVSWAGAPRLQLGARLVYRSDRFEDMSNLTLWPAAWALDLLAIWQTQDKRWNFGLGAINLGGNKSARQFERYVADVRYRF